jgi:hypothetical protein
MQALKRYTCLFFLFYCSLASAYHTKNDSTLNNIHCPQRPNFIIKSSPFPILWGTIPLTSEYRWIYEFTTTAKQSSQIGISYLGKNLISALVDTANTLDKLKVRGLRFQGWYKFYYGRDKLAPRGAYFAPHVSWAFAHLAPEKYMKLDRYLLVRHLNIDLQLGYQFFINHFAVDVFMSYGYKQHDWYDHLTTSRFKKTGIFGTPTNAPPPPGPYFDIYSRPTKFQVGINFGFGRK